MTETSGWRLKYAQYPAGFSPTHSKVHPPFDCCDFVSNGWSLPFSARTCIFYYNRTTFSKKIYIYIRERNPFVVRGRRADYFSGWLETSDLEAFISGQSMQYGTDLDVTNYVNKRRVTLNPAAPAPPPEQSSSPPPKKGGHKGKGKGGASTGGNGASGDAHLAATGGAGGAVVTPNFVWQKFREGCSLRMPCPQKFSDPLHLLLSALEEEFGCMVGSNVYLTPPRSQGFAPHWDDIEAFLLQVGLGGPLFLYFFQNKFNAGQR